MKVIALINKTTGWFDYTLHNPFINKKKVKKNQECMKYYLSKNTYAEAHKYDQDELLLGLKALIAPKKSKLDSAMEKLKYQFERFKRAHTDVLADVFKVDKKSKATFEALMEKERKIPSVNEAQKRIEKMQKEWKLKEKAKRILEDGECFMNEEENRRQKRLEH